MQKLAWIIYVVSFLLVISIPLHYQAKEEEEPIQQENAILTAENTATAPSFTLSSLSGQRHSLSEWQGKPMMINFWASWCGPCKQEMPELITISEHYQDKLTILAVNLTKGDSISEVKNFVEKHKLPFPVLLDKKGEVEKLYSVVAVPTTFFIDKKGRIVDTMVGYGGEGSLAVKAVELMEHQ